MTGSGETWVSTVTGAEALDEPMAKTPAQKACLLRGRTHPERSLHHNPAALGARARGRQRHVSFGPRTREGAQAWDTFMTLAAPAMTLGVRFSHAIPDRVSGASQRPALADLMPERAQDLNLGASWNTSSPHPRLLKRYALISYKTEEDDGLSFSANIIRRFLKDHKNGYDVWTDTTSLKAGEEWNRQIHDQIPRSDVLLLLVAEATAKSNWVAREIDFAKGGACHSASHSNTGRLRHQASMERFDLTTVKYLKILNGTQAELKGLWTTRTAEGKDD